MFNSLTSWLLLLLLLDVVHLITNNYDVQNRYERTKFSPSANTGNNRHYNDIKYTGQCIQWCNNMGKECNTMQVHEMERRGKECILHDVPYHSGTAYETRYQYSVFAKEVRFDQYNSFSYFL